MFPSHPLLNTINNDLFADMQPEDSGVYQCYLTDHSQNIIIQSLEIIVKGYHFILT